MGTQFVTRNVNTALPMLADAVLRGNERASRAGNTMELLYPQITLVNPLEREVTHPDRRAHLPAQIAETMWVLAGRNDVDWLANYLPRAPDFSDDGKVWRAGYGPRLRKWGKVDQLQRVIDLLSADPDTRRAVVSLFDPASDFGDSKDIPCNNWLHFMCRDGILNLHVAVRSNDLMWGWSGINAFEWSTVLEIVAALCNMIPGKLVFSTSSLHLYEQHWEKARKIIESSAPAWERPSGWMPSPRFKMPDDMSMNKLFTEWFKIEHRIRNAEQDGESQSKLVLIISDFPEPMLKSWLQVLAWWWSGRQEHLLGISTTALARAAFLTPGASTRRGNREEKHPTSKSGFEEFVVNLHREKNAVYGDSWKRRGEQIGIMANIARKVDRLGVGGAGDTAADTVIDLLVYLAKYRLWLSEFQNIPILGKVRSGGDYAGLTDEVGAVERFLDSSFKCRWSSTGEQAITFLSAQFNRLELEVTSQASGVTSPHVKAGIVELMIGAAAPLARSLWNEEQK